MRISDWSSDVCSSDLCLLVLLALVASAIAGGMPNAGLIPAQLQATLGQDDGASSISADGQALVVNGGPGDTVARMHFPLPARTGHGDQWVVWVERKPVQRPQLAGEGWHSADHGFFRPDPDDGPDRNSLVEGKSVAVRLDLGGSRIIKKH